MMNQTINNYEILPASSFFNFLDKLSFVNFSDILAIVTILVAIITLNKTMKNNDETLKKTLEYETNKRRILEFNEIAVSIKAVEYELKKLDKILKEEIGLFNNTVSYTETKALFDLVNSISDKVFDMESQFDLKSYYEVIQNIDGMIDNDARRALNKSTDLLCKKYSYNDFEITKEKEINGIDRNTNKRDDTLERINDMIKFGNLIAKKELAIYLSMISSAKEALIAEIAKINTSDFN